MLKAISEIGRKNDEANKILLDVKKIDAKLDTAELVCTKADVTKLNFNTFASPLKFIEKIYNYEITLDEAKNDQDKSENLIIRLENYKPRMKRMNKEKRREKYRLKICRRIVSCERRYYWFFWKTNFAFKDNVFKTKEEIKEKTKEEIERFISNGIALIERESKGINNDLCKKHFDFLTPIDLAKYYLK